MLVAASPCALAISVPVTVVAAVGAASKLGVLVKGGAALEALGAVRGVALDKTGTLTANRPTVIDVVTTDGTSREHVLAVAAALEARSEHPLARAVLAAVDDVTAAEDVETVTGAGLTGRLDGRQIRLGRPGWLEAGPLAGDVRRMQSAGATAVLVEEDGQVIGAVAVRDELRPEAAEVVDRLRRDGYHVAMLTGDNLTTATALAKEVGIDDVHAELRPEDKARLIEQLRTSGPPRWSATASTTPPPWPPLTSASRWAPWAPTSRSRPPTWHSWARTSGTYPKAFTHARRARSIMLQNVSLSLAIVVVLMPLALFGVLGLAAVVLVHELAEVVVIANGVRAGRSKPLPDLIHRGQLPAARATAVGASS